MRYLLDTNTFLWWITNDARLSERIRSLLRDSENEVFFSAASAWEIAIKARLGRLAFESDPEVVIPQQLIANGFSCLSVEVRHGLRVFQLPLLHRDPFDRLLVAQALVEGMPLLTSDSSIAQYQVPVIW